MWVILQLVRAEGKRACPGCAGQEVGVSPSLLPSLLQRGSSAALQCLSPHSTWPHFQSAAVVIGSGRAGHVSAGCSHARFASTGAVCDSLQVLLQVLT